MKKACISLLIFLIIILSFIGVYISSESSPKKEYLRIHVRANSNLSIDQDVKYLVKDAVVEYLAPFISKCDTREKAKAMLKNNLDDVERVAKGVLEKNGFTYGAKASLRTEEFPERKYGDLTLEQGFYEALILELGEANGNNWWCVVYPPLCFVGDGVGYKYKSKIIEIINDFFN